MTQLAELPPADEGLQPHRHRSAIVPIGDEQRPGRAGAAVEEELSTQESLLRELDSLRGFQRWRDETVRLQRADLRAGRPRPMLKSAFETWQRYLAAGIRRMIVGGELAAEADADALAIAILAAVQGGVLLARTSRQIHQLEVALDTAIDQVRAYIPKAPRT